MQFAGRTYVPERDQKRLTTQYERVEREVLYYQSHFPPGNRWFYLRELSDELDIPEASLSARLRDLRKNGYIVERQYVRRGLHRYRVTKP